MAEQELNGTEVRAIFEHVGRKAVAQGMGVYAFLQAGTLGGFVDGVPNAPGPQGNFTVGLSALA